MALFREENTLITDQPVLNNPALRYIMYAIITLLTSVIHVLFIRFVTVGGVAPDLLLIVCIWIALVEGQMVGLMVAFGAGLLFDIVSADVLGTNALAKILAVFIAGYFYNENLSRRVLGTYRFLFIVLFCSFIHNLVYFFFYIQPTGINFFDFFIRYGIATTLYTTVIAIVPMLIMARKSEF